MTSDDGEPPRWDEQFARQMIGKRVLVGLTFLDHRGDVAELNEFHGTVVSASEEEGIVLELAGIRQGETYVLPPQPDAFFPASEGEYRLRSTGEMVVNPDYTSTWTIHPPESTPDAS